MGNKGAYIRFEAPDLKPNIVTFSAVVSSFVFPSIFNNHFPPRKYENKFDIITL